LPGYERNEELTNFIYIGYQPNINLPSEKIIHEEIGRFAEIRDIYCKQN
jgi:hypothetical protein